METFTIAEDSLSRGGTKQWAIVNPFNKGTYPQWLIFAYPGANNFGFTALGQRVA